MSDKPDPAAQQEYERALAAYRAAQALLVEAKKRLPETARDRHKRLKREEAARLRSAGRPDPKAEELLRQSRATLAQSSAAKWSTDFWSEYLRENMWPDIDADLARKTSEAEP